MSRVITLEGFIPSKRFDNLPWTAGRIEESANAGGPWTPIETQTFGTGTQPAPDPDPTNPRERNFTTSQAQLAAGYYRIVFLDAAADEQATGSVYSPSKTAAYTTVGAVRRILSPDGDPTDTSTASSLSDDEIESAIEESAAEINARLAPHHTLPFDDPIPPLIEALNRDLAAYLATLTFRRSDPIDPTDPVQLRYDRAQAILKQAGAGSIDLLGVTGTDTTTSNDPEVINPYEGDLFLPRDFALGPAPYSRPGLMQGLDDWGAF